MRKTDTQLFLEQNVLLLAYVCWCVRQIVTIRESIPCSEYSFEEVWRFINRIGGVFLQIEEASLMEVKTGFIKNEDDVEKIIRFIDEEREVSRVCPGCWSNEYGCNGVDIRIFHDALAKYIENIYIE